MHLFQTQDIECHYFTTVCDEFLIFLILFQTEDLQSELEVPDHIVHMATKVFLLR